MHSNKKTNLSSKTLSSLVVMFMGNSFQSLIQLIVLMVLSRLLIPEDFGVVAAALIIIGFSNIFSQLGVSQAIVQRPTLEENHIKTGYSLSLIMGMFFSILIYIMSPLISHFFKLDNLEIVIKVLSIMFLIQGHSIVGEALLQRKMNFKVIVKIQNMSYFFGYGVVSIVMAIMDFGFWSLIVGQISNVLIKAILIHIYENHSKSLIIKRKELNELLYFGTGFTIARIFNYIALQGDKLVIGKLLGAEALGLYSRAYQVMTLPSVVIGQVVDKVMFPAMAQVQTDKNKLTKAYTRGVSFITLVVLPLSAYIFVYSEEIVTILLGKGWEDVILPFQILSIGMVLRTSYKMSESIARATGAVYKRAWRQGIYAGLILICSVIGSKWGIEGVAISVLFALFINFILMAQLSLNIIGIKWKVFLGIHLPSLMLTIFSTSGILLLKVLLKQQNFGVYSIVIMSLFIYVSISLLLITLAPRIFLGKEGMWMINLGIGRIKRLAGGIRNGK